MQMLSVGSCTAPLALDMSVLVPVLTTVLSLHIDAPEHDPKVFKAHLFICGASYMGVQ